MAGLMKELANMQKLCDTVSQVKQASDHGAAFRVWEIKTAIGAHRICRERIRGVFRSFGANQFNCKMTAELVRQASLIVVENANAASRGGGDVKR